MKKRIILGLLFLNAFYSAKAAQNEYTMPDPSTFAHELDAYSNEEYSPAPKPWLSSFAATCAEHMPEAAMIAAATAICAIYCKYDDIKDWAGNLKPKFQAMVERCVRWLHGKKNESNKKKQS